MSWTFWFDRRVAAFLSVAVALIVFLVPARIASPGPTMREPRRGTTSTGELPRLRCWQEGVLIFEEQGWKALSMKPEQKVVLRSGKKAGKDLVLMEIGTATCLLEEG